jgi:hypothetical protein
MPTRNKWRNVGRFSKVSAPVWDITASISIEVKSVLTDAAANGMYIFNMPKRPFWLYSEFRLHGNYFLFLMQCSTATWVGNVSYNHI